MLTNLQKYNILLASKSPRRRELLGQLRVPFHTISLGGVDETYPADMAAHDVPAYLSQQKGKAYRRAIRDNELIITADTLVICDGRIMGKPTDAADAERMLHFLSGKTHQVVTGVTVMTADRTETFSVSTDVEFAEISDEEIHWYVHMYRPLDKAGAYGIQEWIGAAAVKGLRGSYYNVVGLPLHALYDVLKTF